MRTCAGLPCINYFTSPQEPGLSDFLVGAIDDLPYVETVVPNLYVLPAGMIPPNPSELMGSDRMRELLGRSLEQFGRVILDSPPLISVTDAAILSTQVEGVLLVVKAEAVPRKVAIDAKGQLVEINASILGTVFNNVPIHHDGYYYNYYHYRYRSYYSKDSGGLERTRHGSKSHHGHFGWLKDRLNNFIRKSS